MQVLVIEDNPADLKLMWAVLSIDGHSVEGRATAEGVMEIIEADTPEVMLLDLHLPGMDGLTLVRRITANANTRQTPIVAMTACADSFQREELMAAGCEAFIVKPVNTRELTKRIE